MNTSDFKKTYFLIIAAIILTFALLIGGFLSYKRQKELARQEKVSACLKSLETSSLEDIAQLARDKFEKQDLFSRYLRCRFPWFASTKIIGKYGFLLELAGISEATRRGFEEREKSKILNLDNKDNFRFILGYLLSPEVPLDVVCPGGILDEDLAIFIKDELSAGPFYSQDNIKMYIDNICPLMFRYSNNFDLFDAEILKKSTWPLDVYERRLVYRQNLALAVRFIAKNTDEAPNFCRNLPNREEIDDCRNHWLSLSEGKEKSFLKIKALMAVTPPLQECNKILIDIKQEICAR